MVLIIYKSRKTDSLVGASPSGKAPGFGPGISEVRILPPQNNKRLSKESLFFSIFYYYLPSLCLLSLYLIAQYILKVQVVLFQKPVMNTKGLYRIPFLFLDHSLLCKIRVVVLNFLFRYFFSIHF